MGSFLCKQPNGLYCRYSSIVGCPTHWNMTKEEYIEYRKQMAAEEAENILKKVDEGRFYPSFNDIVENFYPGEMSQEEFDEVVRLANTPIEKFSRKEV